jgi:NodT family efflux transporter outer membrane factor (OMF) lipoprotein
MRRWIGAAIVALALTGCAAVGPDYRSPAARAPSQTPFVSARSAAFTQDQPPGRWWSLFADPVLDGLVQRARVANADLRVAAANLARARALLREARAARLPVTQISASASYGQEPGLPASTLYDAGLDASYQVDLFGGIRRAIEASRADVGAVQAALDNSRISVAAETARAYVDACSAGQQLAVARESLRVQEQTFDLTRRLVEGGRGTALEAEQAGAQLEQVRASLPTFEAQRQAALFRLAVLTGRAPADFPVEVAQCSRPPALSKPVPVGDGASLLARRPDIRQAERELAAATARVGVAIADLYPKVSLGGSAGLTSTSIGSVASGDAFRFSLGPLISWSFPNTAVARARVAQAQASAASALANFDSRWLHALEETESGLVRYSRERERRESLSRARARAAEAARIARLRYEHGRESFQIVLDAERSLAAIEGELARSDAQLADYLVSLFLALGGGWQEAPALAARS